jgi:UDP-N-acetylmuramyl pentapeptide phosphotransferase/UDP-N-acetylglucosamine-1-phosphate transferase
VWIKSLMSEELQIYLSCLLIPFFISWVIYSLPSHGIELARDSFFGPQKIHHGFVPRVGGVGIVVGLTISLIFFFNDSSSLLLLLISASLPVFLAGVIEDFTGSVTAKVRFIASLLAGSFFCWMTGYQITGVGIGLVDILFAVPVVSFLLTALAVATMVNALNIIDGLNGLAGATSTLMFLTFGILAVDAGDSTLKIICFSSALACVGFLTWNFPFGKLFLGDGGAYFLGFLVAAIAVLLTERNDYISPFCSFLIVIYPLYELLRTLIRRVSDQSHRAFEPDDKHLHSLIFKFVARQFSIGRTMQNSLAAFLTFLLPSLCCLWALTFSNDRALLLMGTLAFIIVYEFVRVKVVSLSPQND